MQVRFRKLHSVFQLGRGVVPGDHLIQLLFLDLVVATCSLLNEVGSDVRNGPEAGLGSVSVVLWIRF